MRVYLIAKSESDLPSIHFARHCNSRWFEDGDEKAEKDLSGDIGDDWWGCVTFDNIVTIHAQLIIIGFGMLCHDGDGIVDCPTR